jgi:hypothetical protein
MEAARLRSANDRLLFLAHKNWQQQIRPAVNAPGRSPGNRAAAGSPAPPRRYRNEGQATPLSALQTFAWACDRGDTATVTKLLCFEGGGRAKAEAFMATLPEKTRSQWSSPEAMAATLLTADNMHHPFPDAEVLGEATAEPVGDGRVMLRLPGSPKDRTEYQKTEAGWKYVIKEAVVDAYVARASAARTPAQP